MNIPKRLHLSAAKFKDKLINVLCDLGLVRDPQTLTINAVQAVYRVTSASERWRVQEAMGERAVLEEFVDHVSDGDCVWDIGAAVGTYSCLAANAGATVVAFEPHPENRHRCIENLQLNDAEFDVLEIALSDEKTSMALAEDAGVGSGMHRLSTEGTYQVDAIPGDDVSASQPDILKIDVEGHEIAVLDGLSERLRSVRAVFVECHPNMGVPESTVRKNLTAAGLSVETIDTDRYDELFLLGTRD